VLSFHTDTHYTQPLQQSNRRSRCTISGWSITKQFSERSSLLLILLLRLFHHFTLFHFIQALTTLHLPWNQIGDKGAQYLAEALRNNSVRDHHSFSFFFFFLYSIILLFSISYRHSLHSTFTTIKSEIKVHNIWLKHYETIQWEIITPSYSYSSSSSFIPSFYSFPFHTGTHYARPWQE